MNKYTVQQWNKECSGTNSDDTGHEPFATTNQFYGHSQSWQTWILPSWRLKCYRPPIGKEVQLQRYRLPSEIESEEVNLLNRLCWNVTWVLSCHIGSWDATHQQRLPELMCCIEEPIPNDSATSIIKLDSDRHLTALAPAWLVDEFINQSSHLPYRPHKFKSLIKQIEGNLYDRCYNEL